MTANTKTTPHGETQVFNPANRKGQTMTTMPDDNTAPVSVEDFVDDTNKRRIALARADAEMATEAEKAAKAAYEKAAKAAEKARAQAERQPENGQDASLQAVLQAIAFDRLGIETLETRNSDSLDFHEISVGGLAEALTRAYEIGRQDAKKRITRRQQ